MHLKLRIFLICLILPFTANAAETIETDVCVYGATGGGIAAAIQAARLGKSVALVEPTAHIGGINIEGLGGSDINNHNFINDIVVGGLAKDFYLRLGKKYGKDGPAYKFEPHVAEEVFNEWVAEHKIKLFLNHRISEAKGSVEKTGAKITSLRMENGAVVRAKVFIDATIEGDLLAFAGVKTVIGREANSLYGETKNGIRAENTYRQFAVKVDRTKFSAIRRAASFQPFKTSRSARPAMATTASRVTVSACASPRAKTTASRSRNPRTLIALNTKYICATSKLAGNSGRPAQDCRTAKPIREAGTIFPRIFMA
jgi:hypothetical protein